MSKVVLADTISGYNLSVINSNFDKIEAALNDKVLYRDNPDGEPNSMADPLDMNGQRIINLPAPGSLNDAARMQDVVDATAGITNATAMPFSPTATISATNVQGAIAEADTENRALSSAITTNLADSSDVAKGDALVALKRTITNAVATTVHAFVEASPLSVTDFGAVGNDSTDNATAFSNAVAAAVASGKGLIIPPGTYRNSQPFDFGFANLTVIGIGHVVLKYTGAGTQCLKVDNGTGAVAYRNSIHNITIEGSGAASQIGMYQRNFVHTKRSDIRVRNVTGSAFSINGDVLSDWVNCGTTINEGSMTSTPTQAFVIDGTAVISDTTDCNFIMCMGEGVTQYGINAIRMAYCNWLGGTMEGMPTGTGINLTANAVGNIFFNMFCEANLVGGDLILAGKRNKFIGGVLSSRKATVPYEDVKAITVNSGAELNTFDGVKSYTALVNSGASFTKFIECDFEFKIDDSGTNTKILDTRQAFNTSSIIKDVKELTGSAAYNPPSLADGVGASTTVNISGAALGDLVLVSFSNDLQGIDLTGYVASAGVIGIRFQNETGGALDLASGTLFVKVLKN